MYIIEYMNEGTSHWVQSSSNTSETAAIVNARNQLKRSKEPLNKSIEPVRI